MKTMKITLESNPSDVPCGMKIVADDGRDTLIQTDYDWPGVAGSFGWIAANDLKENRCEHSGTDGTVDCPDCGVTASQFIQAAGQWLREHDGLTADFPDATIEPQMKEPKHGN